MTAGHCTGSGRGITRRDLGRVALASVLAGSSTRAAAAMPSAPRAVVAEPAWRADFPCFRAGALAALPPLKHSGVSETPRASCYLYTNTSELDRLAAALRELAG